MEKIKDLSTLPRHIIQCTGSKKWFYNSQNGALIHKDNLHHHLPKPPPNHEGIWRKDMICENNYDVFIIINKIVVY